MSLNRIKYMRNCLDDENLDLTEIAEIEEAYHKLCNTSIELIDDPEHALANDMLDELERLVSPLERELYEYVAENYGHNEADDPCYDLGEIANHLENKFEVKEK